ncbi:MAG TPA: entericidin A/B family lipoprotein [Methylophaga aminisulfidivorans]|uniref:Entericidin A/B family lipoprotein n=2 Tax=root TaxID=1 RepID=A0A7C1W362_9GAMM|nr:entericidin A/B family lipoprotein [Methylophaga aminisulfidivorans]
MRTLILSLAILFTLNLSACNTMEGIGKDVGAAGDALEKSASDKKGY